MKLKRGRGLAVFSTTMGLYDWIVVVVVVVVVDVVVLCLFLTLH